MRTAIPDRLTVLQWMTPHSYIEAAVTGLSGLLNNKKEDTNLGGGTCGKSWEKMWMNTTKIYCRHVGNSARIHLKYVFIIFIQFKAL